MSAGQGPGPSGRAGHAPGRTPWRLYWRWWISFGTTSLVIIGWSLATPLMASPDEPSHVIKAAAVVRGQLIGAPQHEPAHLVSGNTTVQVPTVFGGLDASCFAFKSSIPASCQRSAPATNSKLRFVTSAGRYPPLYYAVVGLPSLLWTSTAGIRIMRILSGLACAALLASAFVSAAGHRRRALLVWGVAIATTPLVLFLAGVVNPSGLEIAAAICLWTSGIALVDDTAARPDGRLLARVGISAAVLAQVRNVSLLWLALIVVALVLLAGLSRIRSMLRDRRTWAWGAVVAVSSLFELGWLAYSHALATTTVAHPTPVPFWRNVKDTLANTDNLLHQMIGVLGWLDTPVPRLSYYAWLAAAMLLVAGGLVLGARRRALLLLGMTAAVILVPAAIQVHDRASLGSFWQGRYSLPLAAGVVVTAAATIPPERLTITRTARLQLIFAGVVVVAGGGVFLQGLRRYTAGLAAGLDPFRGSWHPPLGSIPLTVLFLAALVGWASWLTRLSRSGDGDYTLVATGAPPRDDRFRGRRDPVG
jgi:Predicted membrane protein (DUF2142)